MSIADYMQIENVVLGLPAEGRSKIFRELAQSMVAAGQLPGDEVDHLVAKLEEREAISTTGVGEGIAIPHASLEAVTSTVIVVGVIPGGIDFAAVDGGKVDVVFMIIGSQAVPRQHIQLLAKIVRLCRNKELMGTIRNEKDPREVLEAIRMVDS